MDTFSSATQLEKRLVYSATMKKIPLGGAFELLPLCNMNCKMCFLRLTPEEMKKQGHLRSADEWLALAEEAKQAGLLFLLLTGGEPFLYPEFKKLYEGLCKLGFILTINTNGTLITEEYADMLAAHRPRRVNITLYGSSDEIYGRLCGNPHGFTQTMKAIQLLKDRKIDIKLNGSLTKQNYDDLENLQQISKELDIPIEVNEYMFPCSRKGSIPFDNASRLSPEEAAEAYTKIKKFELPEPAFEAMVQGLIHIYKQGKDTNESLPPTVMPCRAGQSAFWINWKGNMTPCVFMETPAIPVFEKGFVESWEYIKEERNKIFLAPKCATCGKKDACSICAAAVRYETSVMSDVPTYVCEYTEKKLKKIYEMYYESH